jgi:hypothetical protein
MDFQGLLAESLDAMLRNREDSSTNTSNSRRTRRRPRNTNNTSGTSNSTNNTNNNNSSFLDPITSVHITAVPIPSTTSPTQATTTTSPIPATILDDMKTFSSIPTLYHPSPIQSYQNQNQQFQNSQQQHQSTSQQFQNPLQPLEFDYIGEQPATISTRRFIISSSTSDALDDILRSALFQQQQQPQSQFQQHTNHQQQQQQSYFNFMPTTTMAVTQGLNLIKMADLPVRLVKPHEKVELCPICHESFQIDPFVNELPCGHVFHMDCIMKWLKDQNTCPFCRYKL